jgi:hypothetical protein
MRESEIVFDMRPGQKTENCKTIALASRTQGFITDDTDWPEESESAPWQLRLLLQAKRKALVWFLVHGALLSRGAEKEKPLGRGAFTEHGADSAGFV